MHVHAVYTHQASRQLSWTAVTFGLCFLVPWQLLLGAGWSRWRGNPRGQRYLNVRSLSSVSLRLIVPCTQPSSEWLGVPLVSFRLAAVCSCGSWGFWQSSLAGFCVCVCLLMPLARVLAALQSPRHGLYGLHCVIMLGRAAFLRGFPPSFAVSWPCSFHICTCISSVCLFHFGTFN